MIFCNSAQIQMATGRRCVPFANELPYGMNRDPRRIEPGTSLLLLVLDGLPTMPPSGFVSTSPTPPSTRTALDDNDADVVLIASIGGNSTMTRHLDRVRDLMIQRISKVLIDRAARCCRTRRAEPPAASFRRRTRRERSPRDPAGLGRNRAMALDQTAVETLHST